MFTTNAGINWVTEEGSSNWFNSISINDRSKAWCGASDGKIWYALLNLFNGVSSNNNKIPDKFKLYQNYPNPFNPSTKIKFDVPFFEGSGFSRGAYTKLTIYDILGHDITTLVNQNLKPGTYDITWDASNYTSGVYFYQIISGSYTATKRMVLLK
jgi:hypothetical protein